MDFPKDASGSLAVSGAGLEGLGAIWARGGFPCPWQGWGCVGFKFLPNQTIPCNSLKTDRKHSQLLNSSLIFTCSTLQQHIYFGI